MPDSMLVVLCTVCLGVHDVNTVRWSFADAGESSQCTETVEANKDAGRKPAARKMAARKPAARKVVSEGVSEVTEESAVVSSSGRHIKRKRFYE